MKHIADTNLLVRVVMQDEKKQAKQAAECLKSAEIVAIPTVVLCELAWVLRQGYKLQATEIAELMRRILRSGNVASDASAVTAGIEMLEAGGDFADGIIAHEGKWLGGEEFVSFDKEAVKKLVSAGAKARLLS